MLGSGLGQVVICNGVAYDLTFVFAYDMLCLLVVAVLVYGFALTVCLLGLFLLWLVGGLDSACIALLVGVSGCAVGWLVILLLCCLVGLLGFNLVCLVGVVVKGMVKGWGVREFCKGLFGG